MAAVSALSLIPSHTLRRHGHHLRRAVAAVRQWSRSARGQRLGTPSNLRNVDEGRARGRARCSEIARERAMDLRPVIADLRAAGATNLSQLAAGLNQRGIPTSRGGTWSATQVRRVLERVG